MPARILTLNIGSQAISLGEFRAQPGGGLLLCGVRRREVPADNASDPLRLTQVTDALREMLEELGLKGGRVNYAIPAQATFSRFVKLPAVEEEKIERIIGFEAQQNVPFPIDEVVWDYQLVGGGADEQLQVVLVAIKCDLLEMMNSAVTAAGLRPDIIGVATMGLYNAFRYNYSDVGGTSLLVDIGARTTNLVFIEAGKVFTRSVSLGGSSVTAALAKEFNEPVQLAEARKKESGFVALDTAGEEPSDAVRTGKAVRGVMTRLQAEIMRSVSHYRAQQQGSAPERIYLCGGSSGLPSLREFFAEKLRLPIEVFNPLRNVAVAPEARPEEIGREAHRLGELVGLALRPTHNCPVELTLRPPSVERTRSMERRRPFVVAAAICLVLALLGWSVYYARAGSVLRQRQQDLDQQVSVLRRFQGQLDSVRKDATALDANAAPLLAAVKARSFWPSLLQDLNERLPTENVWITELIPLAGGKPFTPDNAQLAPANATDPTPAPAPARNSRTAGPPAVDSLLLRGLYLWNPRQQEVVVDYFKKLTGSTLLAVDPNNQARVIKPTMPDNTQWAFPYELRLDLKQPAPVP